MCTSGRSPVPPVAKTHILPAARHWAIVAAVDSWYYINLFIPSSSLWWLHPTLQRTVSKPMRPQVNHCLPGHSSQQQGTVLSCSAGAAGSTRRCRGASAGAGRLSAQSCRAQCSALQTAGSATKSDAAAPSADAAGAMCLSFCDPFAISAHHDVIQLHRARVHGDLGAKSCSGCYSRGTQGGIAAVMRRRAGGHKCRRCRGAAPLAAGDYDSISSGSRHHTADCTMLQCMRSACRSGKQSYIMLCSRRLQPSSLRGPLSSRSVSCATSSSSSRRSPPRQLLSLRMPASDAGLTPASVGSASLAACVRLAAGAKRSLLIGAFNHLFADFVSDVSLGLLVCMTDWRSADSHRFPDGRPASASIKEALVMRAGGAGPGEGGTR